MRFEIPNLKRCCLCVPLRYGIILFGYFNLVVTLLIVVMEGIFGISYPTNNMKMYHSMGKFSQYTRMWLPLMLYSLEIIFNVVLLIGAHTKRTRLIRVFYYYGIMTTVAACLAFFVIRYGNEFNDFYYNYLEFSLAFISFVFQAYLLLLIRVELKKLECREGHTYVNHMSEVLVQPSLGDGRNPL